MCKVETKESNILAYKRPDLLEEWDWEKNNELGYDPYVLTYGSTKKVWWSCPKCKSDYDARISNKVRGRSCPYCSGKKVNHTNSLQTLNPELAKEWHPTKNGELTPHDVTCGVSRKVWWVGKCSHEWESSVDQRTSKNTSCPYCSSKKILIGFNDIWTTNPDLAKQLLNPEDGYKYTHSSNKKVDWKCPSCKTIVKNKSVTTIKNNGLSCHICSDGISYPEKIVINVLKQLNIAYEFQKTLNNDSKFRYDFYLKDYNMIIETHGGQHYMKNNFTSIGGRTLEEEQENDILKEQLAKENGIEHYITIDCRFSEIEWIKKSIIKELKDFFILNYIDWNKSEEYAITSLVVQVCKHFNIGYKISQIVELTNLSDTTVTSYLKRGNKIGLCNYTPFKSRG